MHNAQFYLGKVYLNQPQQNEWTEFMQTSRVLVPSEYFDSFIINPPDPTSEDTYQLVWPKAKEI